MSRPISPLARESCWKTSLPFYLPVTGRCINYFDVNDADMNFSFSFPVYSGIRIAGININKEGENFRTFDLFIQSLSLEDPFARVQVKFYE